ncbi:M4 family metallopeptidase [bacterium]|nr:M4 family metallopeptidase [bacterium]MBU1918128.1 M4 family metallopeptidase [bacterium]
MSVLGVTMQPSMVPSGSILIGPDVFLQQATLAKQQNDAVGERQAWDHYYDANQRNINRLRWSVQNSGTLATLTFPALSPETLLPETEIPNFRIYDAKNQKDPVFSEARLVRSKGDERNTDPDVNSVYDSLVQSLSFFLERLGLRSIDAKGMVVDAAVNLGQKYNNAYYYNGRIHFGDGDGEIFHNFVQDLTVVAHELGHGIVEMVLGGLTYWSQSGALNEHIADVLGISALQYVLGEMSVPEASWLIGTTAMVPYQDRSSGETISPALRSMSNPGTAYQNHPRIGSDPQSPTMKGYYRGSQDNYGVHINSGIPNHAFYLVATAIGGYSFETIIPIWIEATKALSANPSFQDFANATLKAANNMFPERQDIREAIEIAWTEVLVLGDDAIVIPRAYEIPQGEGRDDIIEIFGLDAQHIADMEQHVLSSALPTMEGVKRCQVGFVLDENNVASLVCLAYVSPQSNIRLPENVNGLPVKTMY